MQFLRTIFWVVLAVAGVIFSLANWTLVTVKLWGDIVVDTRLPVLLVITFLLGLVPMLILYRATRWSLRRRLESVQRVLTDVQAATAAPPAASPTTAPVLADPMPPNYAATP